MPNPPNPIFNPSADTRKLRRSNGEVVGYKKNSAQKASQKRVAKLVEEQSDHNRILQLKTGISKLITAGAPGENIRVQYNVPTPKGAPTPIPITQDDDDDGSQDEI